MSRRHDSFRTGHVNGGVPTDKAMAAVPAICNYIAIT